MRPAWRLGLYGLPGVIERQRLGRPDAVRIGRLLCGRATHKGCNGDGGQNAVDGVLLRC